MAKKDFSSVDTADAKKLVLKYKGQITSAEYLSCEQPEVRLTKLMDIVDGMRKYSEYLLRVGGYELYSSKPIIILFNCPTFAQL